MNPDNSDYDPAINDHSGDLPTKEHGTSHLVRKEGVGGAVGTAVGTATGAAAGAALGSIGGPGGMAVGALVGAAVGALGGKAVGDSAKPDLEQEQAPGERPNAVEPPREGD
ncbi:glycine zipper domain-containing protein [Luteolibacter sp. Populi]|uniref:glycine zipper domain-containing protein n=1 Tax=Luteolibacter sp. Populi TaxID=3230487 RepID=UPI00346570AC